MSIYIYCPYINVQKCDYTKKPCDTSNVYKLSTYCVIGESCNSSLGNWPADGEEITYYFLAHGNSNSYIDCKTVEI